jgi:hypothetical protein
MMKELKEISKKNPFIVPDNYFEEVNRKIISSTVENQSEVKERSIYRKLRPYLAVAASIAVLAILSYTAFYFLNTTKTTKGVPEITLNEFSENYLNDIDLLTLEQNASVLEPGLAQTDLNSKEIIDYLVFDNVDINIIYEQL